MCNIVSYITPIYRDSIIFVNVHSLVPLSFSKSGINLPCSSFWNRNFNVILVFSIHAPKVCLKKYASGLHFVVVWMMTPKQLLQERHRLALDMHDQAESAVIFTSAIIFMWYQLPTYLTHPAIQVTGDSPFANMPLWAGIYKNDITRACIPNHEMESVEFL